MVRKNYWLFISCVLIVGAIIAEVWKLTIDSYRPTIDTSAYVVSAEMLKPEIEVPLYILSWLFGVVIVCILYWGLSKLKVKSK